MYMLGGWVSGNRKLDKVVCVFDSFYSTANFLSATVNANDVKTLMLMLILMMILL
jgi:hypothetical protein